MRVCVTERAEGLGGALSLTRQRAKLQKVGEHYLACVRNTKACIAYFQYARNPRFIFIKLAGTETCVSRY